jgi:hypothetical protein
MIATSTASSGRANEYPKITNIAKLKKLKYAAAPSIASGIGPTCAYLLPNTSAQPVMIVQRKF